MCAYCRSMFIITMASVSGTKTQSRRLRSSTRSICMVAGLSSPVYERVLVECLG